MFEFKSFSRRWKVLINCAGLSCLGSALLLQTIVIASILQNGYFRGIEKNPAILLLEAFLTAFGAVYLVYLYVHFIYDAKN